MSDVVKWVRDGLRGAKSALVRGEAPRAFVTRFGTLSAAEKALVLREVPDFEAEYVALAKGIVRLAARRGCDAGVRVGR